MRIGFFKKIIIITLVFFVLKYYFPITYENSKISEKTYDSSKYFNGAYEPNPKKFIIYTCAPECVQPESCFKKTFRRWCGGTADRLKGISSAFLWSILTNRTFLIRATNPCPLQESLDSNVIQWYETLDDVIKQIDMNEISKVFVEFYVSSNKIQVFENGIEISNNTLYDLFNYQNNKDVIVFKSNYDVSNIMANKTIYHNRIDQLGFKRPNDIRLPHSFGAIYKMLFKLRPRLQKQHEEFLRRAKPTENTKLICAQIRIGGKTDNFNDQLRMDAGNTKIIWQFIRNQFDLANLKGYKIYITSDRKEIEDEAKHYFGSDNVVFTNGEITHIDRDKLNGLIQDLNECTRYDKTFIDFHILQHCDMGVISRSGFGRLGIYNRDGPTNNIFTYKFKDGKYDFLKTY